MDVTVTVRWLKDLAVSPKTTRWLCPLILAADATLCGLIIWRVPYTEIDWKAYMEQIQLYVDGERDYTKIKGGTGPLVYPAAHVYIFKALYSLTDRGSNILLAQGIFGLLYLATSGLVMACYRLTETPPYIFPLLMLSRRLHSIYMLRLFNDGFAVFGMFLAIYAYQRRWWKCGTLVYSVSVAIKMSVLLVLPAVAVVVYLGSVIRRPFYGGLVQAFLMIYVQVHLGLPFLRQNTAGYLSRAFDITRQFLFEWTVNWRFVGEDIFLSRTFTIFLLIAHMSLLTLFITTRWIRPTGRSLPQVLRMVFHPSPMKYANAVSRRITPDLILTSILTANAVGMLCARSLHYQFYAWLAWGTPYLLHRTGFHPVLVYILWAAQEWSWNVFPSTNLSSSVVVGVLTITVVGVWIGARDEFIPVDDSTIVKLTSREHIE